MDPAARGRLLRRAFLLALFTVGWNVVEAVVALYAAFASGSIALLGFGLDSIVESASGTVIAWRTRAEMRARDADAVEALERRAGKLVGASLGLLALYVAFESIRALLAREVPGVSRIGIGLLVASILVMRFLATAKRRTGRALGSRSVEADAFQTDACFWLSVFALLGIVLNATLGWWWADPLAALAMTVPIGLEAREAWEGEDD